jgi:ABC-type multidrug transport system fused ATPase/permease subunit
MKLLYRYYDVQGGAIRIDGQDVRGVTLDSLRDSFGMVPQDPSLFNISIMENVRYARLDATDEEVKDACRAAAIHDKIETFPDKYESTVGERGVKLSGGELQRIAIARAILRQPKIVLLDEATSMIDAETEALIQEALKRLRQSRTTFIIAHRLSTIQHADLILVVHDGKIVERGTHDELFRMNGKYVALWSKQLSKEVKDIGSTLHVESKDEALIDLDPEPVSKASPSDEADDADDESS